MPGLHEATSSSPPDNRLSTGSMLPGSQVSEKLLVSSFLTCGISNNLVGREDVLIRDSIPRELDAEEDGSDVEDPLQ